MFIKAREIGILPQVTVINLQNVNRVEALEDLADELIEIVDHMVTESLDEVVRTKSLGLKVTVSLVEWEVDKDSEVYE
jgi:hypothetical protein